MEGKSLVLENAIGFSGKVSGSLLLHEGVDAAHIIYPLGSTIVIRNVEDASDQTFLRAHTQAVSCIAMNGDKTRLASGQKNHMGYVADIIIWDITDIKDPKLVHKLSLHKVEVQSVAFSCDGDPAPARQLRLHTRGTNASRHPEGLPTKAPAAAIGALCPPCGGKDLRRHGLVFPLGTAYISDLSLRRRVPRLYWWAG